MEMIDFKNTDIHRKKLENQNKNIKIQINDTTIREYLEDVMRSFQIRTTRSQKKTTKNNDQRIDPWIDNILIQIWSSDSQNNMADLSSIVWHQEIWDTISWFNVNSMNKGSKIIFSTIYVLWDEVVVELCIILIYESLFFKNIKVIQQNSDYNIIVNTISLKKYRRKTTRK